MSKIPEEIINYADVELNLLRDILNTLQEIQESISRISNFVLEVWLDEAEKQIEEIDEDLRSNWAI